MQHGTGFDSDDEAYSWREVVTTKNFTGFDLLNAATTDPWKQQEGQEATPLATPKLGGDKSAAAAVMAVAVEVEVKNVVEETEIEKIERELKETNALQRERTSNDEEQLFALDATAEHEELLQKTKNLQSKIQACILKVFETQQQHQSQALENRMLKEYVQNLLASASTQGSDRFGRPIPAHRSSSLSQK